METKISKSLLTSIFLGKFWNSLTFPWLFHFFLNFPDWKCNSLTFPWPGKFFIFQYFFPDRGKPCGCLSDLGPGNVWDETGLNGLSWVDDLNKLLIRPWLSGLFNFFLGGMVKTKVNNSWSAIVTAQTMFTICSVRTDQWHHYNMCSYSGALL